MKHQMASHESTGKNQEKPAHYRTLAIMLALSFVCMYALMYAMVNTFANVYHNINQVYMAALMAAPMALIELALMRMMYQDRTKNLIVIGVSVLVWASAWFAIRSQAAVGDRQFVRSMIPHHAGAVLMCREASIRDAEIKTLCVGIMQSQQAEIEQMKAILRRLD